MLVTGDATASVAVSRTPGQDRAWGERVSRNRKGDDRLSIRVLARVSGSLGAVLVASAALAALLPKPMQATFGPAFGVICVGAVILLAIAPDVAQRVVIGLVAFAPLIGAVTVPLELISAPTISFVAALMPSDQGRPSLAPGGMPPTGVQGRIDPTPPRVTIRSVRTLMDTKPSRGREVVKGVLASDVRACVRGRKVVVDENRKRTSRATISAADGSWIVSKLASGDAKVVVPRATVPLSSTVFVDCRPAASTITRALSADRYEGGSREIPPLVGEEPDPALTVISETPTPAPSASRSPRPTLPPEQATPVPPTPEPIEEESSG